MLQLKKTNTMYGPNYEFKNMPKPMRMEELKELIEGAYYPFKLLAGENAVIWHAVG